MANRSKRKQIVRHIISELESIQGNISSYDSSYTFNSTLANNVNRGFKFHDEINDFPAVFVQAGIEARIYDSYDSTSGELDVVIRCYVKDDYPQIKIENLIKDVEHIIYNMPQSTEVAVKDIIIDSITTDEGLMSPYGLAEIVVFVSYDLED